MRSKLPQSGEFISTQSVDENTVPEADAPKSPRLYLELAEAEVNTFTARDSDRLSICMFSVLFLSLACPHMCVHTQTHMHARTHEQTAKAIRAINGLSSWF